MKNPKPRVLITAGPTREAIDPVRYISNSSSGKMGYALARAAKNRGCKVTLISGPVSLPRPKGILTESIKTAQEMYKLCLKYLKSHDIVIMVAAVADYRVAHVAPQKIKKSKKSMSLKLIKNPDILAALGKKKKPNQLLVGFAAETQNINNFALEKLHKKNLDLIVVNDVSKKDIGFDTEKNEVTLLFKSGEEIFFKKMPKRILAKKMVPIIVSHFMKNKK